MPKTKDLPIMENMALRFVSFGQIRKRYLWLLEGAEQNLVQCEKVQERPTTPPNNNDQNVYDIDYAPPGESLWITLPLSDDMIILSALSIDQSLASDRELLVHSGELDSQTRLWILSLGNLDTMDEP